MTAGVAGSVAGAEGAVTAVVEADVVADAGGVELQAARAAGSDIEVRLAHQFRIDIAVVPDVGAFPTILSLPASLDPESSGPGPGSGWN